MASAVLLIHPDSQWRRAARQALEAADHVVQEAPDASGAWSLSERRADVVLLPWTTPKLLRDVLEHMRDDEALRRSRVIVWAPEAQMGQAVCALELGADDCLPLPFEATELVARVNACLRRPAMTPPSDRLTAGPLILDKAIHCLYVRGQSVDLAPTEFRLLAFLLEHQSRVFSRDELLRRAWPRAVTAGHRTVDVHVRRLRQALEPFGCDDLIQTVRGFGYRFAPQRVETRLPEPARVARAAGAAVTEPQPSFHIPSTRRT